MNRVLRLDFFALDVLRTDFVSEAKWDITTQGFLKTDARLARVGVLVYQLGGGQVRRELRLPEEVFKPDSMATLAGAPLTILHPPLVDPLITPANYRQHAIGFIGDAIEREADTFITGKVTIQDATAIGRAQSRELCELSPGYVCRLDMTAGVHEKYGAYDCIQREILYNHVGLGPRGWGRSGSEVALKLDGIEAGRFVHEDGDDTEAAHRDMIGRMSEEARWRNANPDPDPEALRQAMNERNARRATGC